MADRKSAEELALAAFRWGRDAARDWQRYARTAARRAKHEEVFSIRMLHSLEADKWQQVASLHRRNVSILARIIRAIRAEKKASGNPALQAIEVPPGLEPHRNTARVVSYGERKRFDDSDAGLSDLVKAFEERGFFVRRGKRSHDGSAMLSFDLPFDREITLHIKPEGVGAHFFDEEAEK